MDLFQFTFKKRYKGVLVETRKIRISFKSFYETMLYERTGETIFLLEHFKCIPNFHDIPDHVICFENYIPQRISTSEYSVFLQRAFAC